jgi:hypothetical protein
MASPITPETPVGYIVAEDVYVSYREYYGDGTIYGRVDLLTSDGNPVKGSGKSKTDLINANVTLSDIFFGSISGDLVVVPIELQSLPEETPVSAPTENSDAAPTENSDAAPTENSDAVPAENSDTVPAENSDAAPAENSDVAPAENSDVVPEETPVLPPSDTIEPSNESDNRYTVSFSFLGFNITREFSAKIDMDLRKIYLS